MSTPAEKSDAERKKSCGKRLTKSQWVEAETLWKTGEFSLAQLSAKFGITREAMSRHFTKKGIVKGEKSIEDSVRARVEAEATEDRTVLIKRIRETKEESYTWLRLLGRMSVNEIVAAKQAGLPISSVLNSVKAIESAQRVVVSSWEARRSLLGLDKDEAMEEELPDLVIRGMTAEEEAALRSAKERDEELGDTAIAEELADENEEGWVDPAEEDDSSSEGI